ncbi:nephrocystin-1 [Biomphalaria glabrata]|nr:nephrocystin-1-like [Biomphalaria glabrata]
MAPWNKEVGPLSKAQKEGDVLKKKVDQVVKESNKIVSQKVKGDQVTEKQKKLEQMFQNCIDTKTQVTQHLVEVEKLEEKNEPTKMKDFDKKITAELNRVSVMKTLLEETMKKLLPNTQEEDFIKSHQQAEEKGKVEKKEADKTQNEAEDDDEEEEEDDEEEEEDDEEEDDDDEEEEEDDDDDIETDEVKAKKIPKQAAVSTVQKEESEEEEDEDESEEEEEEEKPKPVPRSAVPKLKVEEKKDDEDDKDDDDEDDDDDEEEEDDDNSDDDDIEVPKEKSEKAETVKKETKSQKLHKFETMDDYEGEEDGDLSFKEGEVLVILDTSREDGWWKARNEKGDIGMVPSTYLKKLPEEPEQASEGEEEMSGEDEVDHSTAPRTKRGRKLWRGLKQALNETTVSDVLHALGAVPSGFRLSTLCRKFNEGYMFRLINFLFPKLSHSNLTYKDLLFDPALNKICLRQTKIDRVVTIVSCQQIPPPSAGIDVLDRHVRVCLFDGIHILSNIHSVAVASVDKTQRAWTFTTKLGDLMDPGSHAEFFVRSNANVDNIGILFELGISYLRSSTQEKGEFSCGWVHLPLLDETGNVVTNRSFDLQLHGGTPYEKDVEVDPSISRRATSNSLVALISGNKQPRLAVKISEPKKLLKDLMDTLPDTLVGNTCLLQLYAYYRQCLADVLLRDKLDLNSTELIHSPFLKTFPAVADCPDLMKILRTAWLEKLQEVKRADKPLFSIGSNPLRDEEYMKKLFKDVFMETVYSISSLATLPDYTMGDVDILKLRQEQINRFMEKKRATRTTLAALLSEDFVYEPFNMEEVAFTVIGPYCLMKQQVATEN